MKIAFCFAGQGSQYKGMGIDFYESLKMAKDLYDSFPDIKELCFSDPNNVLNQTKYAQKAILLTSYAISKAIEVYLKPEYVCGLSLGEYTALAFSGVYDIFEAIDIVDRRGTIMQEALPLNTTKMVAIIGASRDTILEELKKVHGVCEVANYNCPGQIVITGENAAVDEAVELLRPKSRRLISLNVSGAFHSSLLTEASVLLREELDMYCPKSPKYKVVYNAIGKESNEFINDLLQKQIRSSVYFEDSILYLIDKGVDTFVEIGPGKVLSGFIRKINPTVKIISISNYDDYLKFIKELNK